MSKYLSKKREDEGFTLIELLVVIVILGILAAVVVFAVGGLGDKGKTEACKTDKKTLATAEEAYFSKNSTYASEADLETEKFITEQSTLHNISGVSASGFTISAVAGSGCP